VFVCVLELMVFRPRCSTRDAFASVVAMNFEHRRVRLGSFTAIRRARARQNRMPMPVHVLTNTPRLRRLLMSVAASGASGRKMTKEEVGAIPALNPTPGP